jgi:cytochrome b561
VNKRSCSGNLRYTLHGARWTFINRQGRRFGHGQMDTHASRWTSIRRINHAVLALTVIFQIIASEWMTRPWRDGAPDSTGRLLFTLHEWAGLIAFIALAFIAWRLFRRGELPRLDAAGRTVLRAQCRSLIGAVLTLNPAAADDTGALARAVQVLGLLLTLWFCATGGAIWLVGASSGTAHRIGDLHELATPLLYAYLGGHAGMALLHRLFAHNPQARHAS